MLTSPMTVVSGSIISRVAPRIDRRSPNKVYVTDDAYQIAEISGVTDKVTRRLQLDNSCGRPNVSNNLALAPDRGARVQGVRQGVLYVTSEGRTIMIVDLYRFAVVGSLTITGGYHIDWPVITANNRLFITDEDWAAVYVYSLKDGLTP